jgi:pyrroloquinoline quinone biosynthesis protein D
MATLTADSRVRLRSGTRLTYDEKRGTQVLLFPEGVLVPNQTANDVIARCDGTNSAAGIAAALAEEYDGVNLEDVLSLLTRLVDRQLAEVVSHD